jgi:hypothetical protein
VFFSFVVKQYELGADVGANNAGLDRAHSLFWVVVEVEQCDDSLVGSVEISLISASIVLLSSRPAFGHVSDGNASLWLPGLLKPISSMALGGYGPPLFSQTNRIIGIPAFLIQKRTVSI